ncbi:MAG: hypothetical protein COB84_10555 [Rhodobacteraceae bacterium]|nr:MAG: hypothetical protein COB84_10555 [Paracoccaceae bacterium]
MTQKFWIGVVAGDHAKIAVENRVCAFSHGKQSAVDKLSVGDPFIYYAPKSGIGEGATIQAFVALGTVTSNAPYQRKWAHTGFTAWVHDAGYEDIREVPTKPMLEDLSFITNPRYWGMAFRRGLFQIEQQDFEVIAKAMRK